MHLQENKPLRELSTFGIGGNARYYLEVNTSVEMCEALRYCHEQKLPFLVIGKGSNCLFDDRGFNGLVILNKISFCHYEAESVHVGAGYSFSLLGVQTARKGFAGLEFASGIPATVGGAVYMNAGANGSETCSHLTEVHYVTELGEEKVFKKEELVFSYRFSSFQKMKGAIASVKFHLALSGDARQKQLAIIDYRTKTQPYKDKSAGCVFRNPQPHHAGALIEKAGLKGFAIGGAEVSTMHANFIVNRDQATAQDVLALAKHIKSIVQEKTGVELEMEIRCIPYQVN